MITFVTFHMSLAPVTRSILGEITASLQIQDNAARWIDILFQSARHFHPDCRCIVLTDETTQLAMPEGIELYRAPAARREDPLWSRLCAERDLLRSGTVDENSHVAFLDSDIVLNAPLDPAFEIAPDFDVALTYRRDPGLLDMPMNAGVLLARAGRTDAILRFFDAVLAEYRQNYRDDLWWGEQRSMAAVAGSEAFADPPPPVIACDSFRIGMLPGHRFNYTPARGEERARIPDERTILHFKNNRKPYMETYWALRSQGGDGR